MASALLSPAALPPLRPATPVSLVPGRADSPRAAEEDSAPITNWARGAEATAARPADGGPPLGENEAAPLAGTMTFREFLSGLNPLQHLPVVGTIYRAVTGDVAPAPMRILGGLITGGPIGMATTIGSVALETLFTSPAAPTATASPALLARAQEAYRSQNG
jgi:hypothetical protein